jgi:hypothetical protein
LKTPVWVKTITSIYRNAIDNCENIEIIENFKNELKKYSAREKSDGHINIHNNLIGKNEEWSEYKKLNEEINFDPENIFHEKCFIKFKVVNGILEIKIEVDDVKRELIYKIPPIPKKASPVFLENIETILNNGDIAEKKFEIIIDEPEVQVSSSFLNKVDSEINNKIKEIVREQEKFPEVKPEVLEFIKSETQNIKRSRLLGEIPDKVIISANQIDNILKNRFNISEIVVSLDSKIEINKLKNILSKYKVIISIPAILFEKDANEMKNNIIELLKNGFDRFEANSYSAIQILSGIDSEKYLGIEMPVLNHIAAKYYYNLGFKSVYCSYEAESSVFKSLSSFTEGKIESLVFGKIKYFQARVESPFFQEGKLFKDKYVEIECFKQNDTNIFASKIPFFLIGKDFKKECIYFDSLTCDLRHFKNPEVILKQILENKYDYTDCSSFNFYKKLT